MPLHHDREIECQRCGELSNRLKYCELCAEIVRREQIASHNEEIRVMMKKAKSWTVQNPIQIKVRPELSFDCGNCPLID